MSRKPLTQIFPFLLPLRSRQRKICFCLGMALDKNRYARTKGAELLAHQIFQAESALINTETGYDIQYQINKVHNLKLAVQTMDKILIHPGETFSFWQLARYAERHQAYREGLVLSRGKLVPGKGGGLCLLSNMLFWLFLNTPLTIVERHPHRIEYFPLPPGGIPGTDATISQGWLDLKVRNETEATYQLDTPDRLKLSLFSDQPCRHRYQSIDSQQHFYRQGKLVYRENHICQVQINARTGEETAKKLLYINRCQICYPLAPHTQIQELPEKREGESDEA